jgi:autotransporter translocation and assembly factor TamB
MTIKRVLTTLAVILLAVIVLAVVALLATQTQRFRDWAAELGERQASRLLNGEVSIGRLEGNLFTGARLSNVRITQEGQDVIVIDELEARYNIWRMFWTDLSLSHLSLLRPRILSVRDERGWQLARLVRRRPADPKSTRTFVIDELTFKDGTVLFEDRTHAGGAVILPRVFELEDLQTTLSIAPSGTEFDISRARFVTERPAHVVKSLAGVVRLSSERLELDNLRVETSRSSLHLQGTYDWARAEQSGRFDARISASPLDLEDLTVYAPDVAGRGLTPSVIASLHGPLDALDVSATVADQRLGRVRAEVTADMTSPSRAIRGELDVQDFDLAALLETRQASRLSANLNLDLHTRGALSLDEMEGRLQIRSASSRVAAYVYDALSVDVRVRKRAFTGAAQARAYGASATAKGTVTVLPGSVRYDVGGVIRDLDLTRLPRNLRIPRLESNLTGAYTARGIGRQIDARMTFQYSTLEQAILWESSEGRIAFMDGTTTYGFDGRVGNLDLERFGRALQIEALSSRRFVSPLTGRLSVEGSGTDRDSLRLHASAGLEAFDLLQTRIETAEIDATLTPESLTGTARGSFSGLDPATLTGRPQLAGSAAGGFDITGTLPALGEKVDLDNVAAEGSVILSATSIGPLVIDEIKLEGRYANRAADVRTLHLTGPAIMLSASGPIALGSEGDSQLVYSLRTERLEDLRQLTNLDLGGQAELQGTVTGNGTKLVSKGQARLTSFRYGTNFEALTTEAIYEASLADLRQESAVVQAKLESTLPVIAGRNLRSLSATVAYADRALQIESTVQDARRTATGSGRLTLFPDHREVVVQHLTITAGETRWGSESGFTLRYGSDGLLTFDEIVLGSGDQRMTATGSLAMSGTQNGTLDVTVEQTQLATLESVMLLGRRLSGTLDAKARITGTAAARRAEAVATILEGSVEDFTFQSFTASLQYRTDTLSIDGRLVQSPAAELTVVGNIPAGFAGNEERPIDLEVRSAGVDLGVVQAVTTAFEAINGPLIANIHIGGTVAAPRMEGTVQVKDGTLTVRTTGVSYQGLVLDVQLVGDMVRVGHLRLVDDDGQVLEGSGQLSFEGRRVREFDVTVNGREFEILDNELGELAVDTSVNLHGTLAAPRISGLVRLHAGRVEADALLERFTSNAYATTPAGEAEESQAESEPAGGPSYDFVVEVPGNLVIRGSDIRPADATIGLGDLNITVGGSFVIRKQSGADAVVAGTVTTVRGTYEFQGRRFEVLRDGTIAFRGDTPIDPALDIQAERVITGIVARIDIHGTMRRPTLALSSRPPLDEADILSLVIFNEPVNQLGEGERISLGDHAASLAGGLVAAPLSQTLERALDVDLFEIETTSDVGGGPAFTVGEQVGERLFVRLRRAFGAQEATEFELEYQLSEFLRLQGSFAEGQGTANRSFTRRVERSGIDLVLFLSF